MRKAVVEAMKEPVKVQKRMLLMVGLILTVILLIQFLEP